MRITDIANRLNSCANKECDRCEFKHVDSCQNALCYAMGIELKQIVESERKTQDDVSKN